MPHTPTVEYPARLARWTRDHAALSIKDRNLAFTRLAVVALTIAVLTLALRATLSFWWLLAPTAAFIALAKIHDRVIRARLAARRLVAFYERGLARLEDRWVGTGDAGERFLEDDHLYAADLDLFGRGSLFELLSLARTRTGEETLAGWLKLPALPDTIRQRHAAIGELRNGLDLREALTLAGDEIRSGVHRDELLAWASTPAAPAVSLGQWLVAAALTIVLPALVIVAWLSGSWTPVVVAALIRITYEHFVGGGHERVLRRADSASRDLDVMRPALDRLERETFESARLQSLQDGLRESGSRATAAIGRLVRYVEMHDWTHNMLFVPVAAVLMWNSHLAWMVERWRVAHRTPIANWLRVVGEFEALSSLAAYSYEHPADPMPLVAEESIAAGAASAIFVGTALSHPLLPSAQMVPNDVRLDAETRLLVVSGSNMSGKSTLLRTVGINAVLALAGAPVRAERLEISPLAIGATLRIQDSLQEGRSRFYAEITRIRRIADQAAAGPMLFLLDELFHGTNSHDRLVGATGVLRSLLDRGAAGLITTHDLALTAITRDVGARAANTHFEDSFDGAEIRFDYRMKPGPVTRSNAIALMRAVGLDIQEDPS